MGFQCIVLVVGELLPSMPWSHNIEEAREVCEFLTRIEMRTPDVPC